MAGLWERRATENCWTRQRQPSMAVGDDKQNKAMVRNINKSTEKDMLVDTSTETNKHNDITHYIKQSYALTSLNGDMTLNQVRILIEMMGVLTNRISDMFERKEITPTFLDSEKDADGNICINIPFKNIVDKTKLYEDIETAAKHFIGMHIEAKAEGDGKRVVSYINAFTSITVAKNENNRRCGVQVKLSPYQAKVLFNFSRYTTYLKVVAKEAKSVYTSRLYMLITSWLFAGTWTVSYAELRQILGCNTYDEKTRKFVSTKYSRYKDFKTRVLKTAEQELKELADEGRTNCYFEVNEIWKDGVKPTLSNDPDKIVFSIYRTKMGELETAKQLCSSRYVEIREYMMNNFELHQSECEKILCKINECMLDRFFESLSDIHSVVIANLGRIKNKRRYALKCIAELLAEFNQDTLPFVETGESVETNNDADEPCDAESVALYNEFIKNNVPVQWQEAFELGSMDDKILTINMSAATCDTFCSIYTDKLFKELGKRMNRKIRIKN